MTRPAGPVGRLAFYIMRASIFSRRCPAGNRADDCFSHARVASTHARLSCPSLLPSHFISKIIFSRRIDTRRRGRERKRTRLETQIFDGDLSTVNLSLFRGSCFGFGTQTRLAERCVGGTRVVAAAAVAYCVSPSV